MRDESAQRSGDEDNGSVTISASSLLREWREQFPWLTISHLERYLKDTPNKDELFARIVNYNEMILSNDWLEALFPVKLLEPYINKMSSREQKKLQKNMESKYPNLSIADIKKSIRTSSTIFAVEQKLRSLAEQKELLAIRHSGHNLRRSRESTSSVSSVSSISSAFSTHQKPLKRYNDRSSQSSLHWTAPQPIKPTLPLRNVEEDQTALEDFMLTSG